MKAGTGFAAAGVVIALAAGGGYWLGQHGRGADAATRQASAAPGAKKERKILYYRNPMGLPDASPEPKKDPMGMDYIPVFEGEQEDEPASANEIKISAEKVQKLGVRTEAAALRPLDKVVRAAGRIEADERLIYAISPKFEGYVERLFVNVTGQPVAKGQPLFEVYSPELVSAQHEYTMAVKGVQALQSAGADAQDSMKQLADASLMRLRNWDIPEEQVKQLTNSGGERRTLTFRSPVTGIVIEKKALQGMRFMPGESLYRIADLSSVWVLADVFEHDIGLVKPGTKAQIKLDAYPDKVFEGKVSYVYPTLTAETRTVPVRIELANPGGLLKPAMYAQVELPASSQKPVVTVPLSAVIDSGTRQLALVQVADGRFEPRDVKLGARSDNYVEVLEGVKDGEPVVVAANFLIDAESNLKAAIGSFGHGGAMPTADSAQGGHDGHGGAATGHSAAGKLEAIDAKAGTASITHGPIADLKWPGMTMDFVLANSSLAGNLKPGDTVAFTFVERNPGEWVIVKLEGTGASRPSAHLGHSDH